MNHVPAGRWDEWIEQIRAMRADALLMTGDLSEGDDVVFELRRLVGVQQMPIYFVLGNHDFYGRSISETRRDVVTLCRQVDSLHYLTDCGPIEIAEGVFLVGEDGWGDTTIGDAQNSPVSLNDFQQITDFHDLSAESRNALLVELGRESADRLDGKLSELPGRTSHVLVATHVPPFRESCLYDNQIANDDWAPFFVGGLVGTSLKNFSRANPRVRVTVLCGHSHHACVAEMSGNLLVYTGRAEYGAPEVQGMLRCLGKQVEVELNQ